MRGGDREGGSGEEEEAGVVGEVGAVERGVGEGGGGGLVVGGPVSERDAEPGDAVVGVFAAAFDEPVGVEQEAGPGGQVVVPGGPGGVRSAPE